MDQPLLSLAILEVLTELQYREVQHFWTLGRGWCMDMLHPLLPQEVIDLLQQVQLSAPGLRQDRPYWSLTTSGKFSTASIRKIWLPAVDVPNNSWSKIWKLKGPLRASLTLWKRGVIPSPTCHGCQYQLQSSLHLLRDCPKSSQVWRTLLSIAEWDAFTRHNRIQDWILCNLYSTSFRSSFGVHWPYIFRQFVQELWLNHYC